MTLAVSNGNLCYHSYHQLHFFTTYLLHPLYNYCHFPVFSLYIHYCSTMASRNTPEQSPVEFVTMGMFILGML